MHMYNEASIFNEQIKKKEEKIIFSFSCLSEECETSTIITSPMCHHTHITITHIKFSLDS